MRRRSIDDSVQELEISQAFVWLFTAALIVYKIRREHFLGLFLGRKTVNDQKERRWIYARSMQGTTGRSYPASVL
jgi:uncharacterized membrane protein